MRIEQVKIDELTFQLNVNIEQADAQEKKKKALNEYRRKADIKGFRKGMAPMSLIEKMHGVSALVEAVNNIISEGLNNYITENKLNILGEPLPNNELQKKIDWENDTTYNFIFDIALAPKVELDLTDKDKIAYYTATVSDDSKKEYKSNMLKQFGKLENTEVVKDEDFIVADLEQGETKIEGSYITLKQIESKTIKKKFIGKKVGDIIAIDVNKAFVNDTDRAALLKIKKEELANIDPNYTAIIKEIKTFVEAEESQDLYDRLFGKDIVKSEAEFDAKVEERIAAEYAQESDYRFVLDAREFLINKTNIQLPETFLKKWLFTINEGKFTMEDIEKDFALFLKDFRWQMIRQYIMREQKMEVKREDLLESAKKIAQYQFAMYGINNVPQEQLNQYAESILANEKEGKRIYEKTEEDMAIAYIKSVVTLNKKDITIEDLHKMTN
ncbi:MAG: trigger factor [Bacteroidales bacterium]